MRLNLLFSEQTIGNSCSSAPPDGICDGFPKNEYFKGLITFKDGGMYDFASAINDAINDAINNPHIDDELPRYSDL